MTEQIDQQYLEGLEKIIDMYTVDATSKSYLKYKAGSLKKAPNGEFLKDTDFTLPLGQTINPNDPRMFLNETQSAVEYEVDHYKKTRKKVVEEAINQNKDKLILDYVEGINKVLGEAQTKIESDLEKKLKNAPKEEKKRILETQLYELLGSFVKDLDITKDYKKNKDLVDAVNGLKEFENLDDADKNEYIADTLTKQNGLSDNYKNFRRPWGDLGGQMASNYTRMIGRALLKESNGKYSINKEALKEAYSNPEAIKKMSPIIAQKYRG